MYTVRERLDVIEYIEKRNLVAQYKKAKKYIEEGHLQSVRFQKRKPLADEIWYFRINKQYRAICYIEGDLVNVFEIDDHQN